MKKQVEFNKVKEVLARLSKQQLNRFPKHQVEANINFFNTMLTQVENESIERWIWPDAETIFSKQNGQCLVYGPIAKYL